MAGEQLVRVTTLYKRGAKDKIQVWTMEVWGDRYRSIEGFKGGALTASAWTRAQPKNIGKKNERSGEQQALLEADAKILKKLEKDYVADEAEVDNVNRFQVQLAHDYKKFPTKIGFPCWSLPKLDGMRSYINKEGMWSRENKPVLSAPHIFEAVKHVFEVHPELILDGELYNHDLKADFNTIISLAKKKKPTPAELILSAEKLQYHIFDVYVPPTGEGKDLIEMPFSTRVAIYRTIAGDSKVIIPVRVDEAKSQEELDKFYAEYLADGYEGQMVRDDKGYENKRSYRLLKRKEFLDDEYPIVDILEGEGNRSGMMGKFVLGSYIHEIKGTDKKPIYTKTFEANARGNYEYYKELLENKEEYIGKWATVRYQNLTPDEVPRFGVVVAIRDYE